MKKFTKLLLTTLGLLASYTAQAQVGIGTGTTTPRTMLDVNGAVSVAETTATVASNAATIPLGYSLVRLTGTATADVTLTAASSPVPVTGQHLVIYNGLSGHSSTFAGQTIVAGQAVALLYTDGAWRPVVTSTVAAAGTNWGLAGNAGTTPGTNFLGTTDKVDLVFKRGNVLAAQLGNGITSFGTAALLANTDSLTMAIGFKAGLANTTGTGNQFVGYRSGQANTTGGYNQFSGFKSGYNTTTGANNQFSGYQSGFSNTTGASNLFSGYKSGSSNTTGSNNQFIGYNSGFNNTTGSNSQFIGYQSGYNTTTGVENQFSGYNSGFSNTSGYINQFIGSRSGYNNTTGYNNQFSGYFSGSGNTTGNYNQFSGFQSGYRNTTGNSNQFIGYQSGSSNTTGSNSQFIGYQSGLSNTTGTQNQFNGFNSGQANTTGNNNQFSGYQSGYSNTTGTQNQFSGYQSGYSNTTGNYNQFSGITSGYNNTTGYFNQFSGNQSGYFNTTGIKNQFTGYDSGINNTTGNQNQFSGYQSGLSNTTGSNNLFSGFNSGYNNTTGSNNTLLGYSSGVATAALTNATAIGSNAMVSQSNSLVLGSINGTNGSLVNTAVGIGTTSPSYPLDVQTTIGGSRSGGYGYLNGNGNTGSSNGSNSPANSVSINAVGRIACAEFNAYSDARLKTVQGQSDSRADLALVQQLQITNYQMKDKVQYGDRAFKKVIAQQVETVFPQAINKNTGFVPTIYATGTLQAGTPGQTLVTVPAAHHLQVGDKVRLMGEANGKVETTVLALRGANTFAVALPRAETKLFVFGPEVTDLRTVDYEALAMLNVSATQELARQVAALQTENAGLKASLADKASASTLTDLQAALQSLQAEVQTLRAGGTTASLK